MTLLRRAPLSGLVGGFLTVLIVALVLLGPLLWTRDPDLQDLSLAFTPPGLDFPFGTDDQGRDVLARFMAGGRVSFLIGALSVLIGFVLGTTLGIVAAMSNRLVEGACLRIVDALLSLPGIVLAVIFAAALGFGIGPLIVALGLYTTPIFARVSHTAARQVLAQDYLMAARSLGAGPIRIAFRYLLPNIATPLIAIASLRVGANVLTGAALNFFGLGVQPPAAEWGLMISDARQFSWEAPYLLLIPGIGLFVTGLAFNLLGDGLRDWLDPHSDERGS